MLDLFDDENEDEYGPPIDKWYRDGNRWMLHRNGKTLIVKRIGWLFPQWRFLVVQQEGITDTLQEAMQKAEAATTVKPNHLRLVRK